MHLNLTEQQSEIFTEIFELSANELEHVAGGPEVTNDPGQ
jgi:hypothetical protein